MQYENLKHKQCNIELTFSLFWAYSHSCMSGSTSSSSWFAHNDTWSIESLQSSIGPLSAGKDKSTTCVPCGTPKHARMINCTAGLLRLRLRATQLMSFETHEQRHLHSIEWTLLAYPLTRCQDRHLRYPTSLRLKGRSLMCLSLRSIPWY
jgi:hypothetical protein